MKFRFIAYCIAMWTWSLLIRSTAGIHEVCSYTYTKKMKIEAVSVLTSSSCQYLILAPNDSYIELNFTDIHGFLPSSNETLSGGGDSRTSSRQHLPEVVIKEKLKSGRDRSRAVICRICRIKTNQQAPQVFHSDSNSLNITYTWIPGQESGFTLNIDFHQKKNNCEFVCDDSTCLRAKSLVCNRLKDCPDGSDEKDCDTKDSTNHSHIVLIVVVILVGCIVVIGIFVYCCRRVVLRSTSCQNNYHLSQSHDHGRSNSAANHDRSPTSRTSTDLRGHHDPRSKPLLSEKPVNLPVSVRRSKDGEEGYKMSQSLLDSHYSDREIYQQGVCAPPNRTVCDGGIDHHRPPSLKDSINSVVSSAQASLKGDSLLDANSSVSSSNWCCSAPHSQYSV